MIPSSILAVALFVTLVSAQREYDNTGMHCKGEGITDLMQWDHAQCSAYCDVRDDCYGYVFNMKDNFTCILKSKTCEMAPSEVWRFYRKPSSGSSPQRAGSNSDWNADPAEPAASSSSFDHGYDTGFGSQMGGDDLVMGPPGNMGNSFTKRDFHCAGKNMGNGEPWSLGECASACIRNDKCIGFIRLITGDQQCILKEAGCTKKPPTVWVFYEKTDNGEVIPEGNSYETAPTMESVASSPLVADAAGGYGGPSPRIDEHFSDTQQHCKGGVISNEMRGHDQCSRACLDAPDCIGYSIAMREPFQCYLKSKECELSGGNPTWTFVRKNDQLSPSAPTILSSVASHQVSSSAHVSSPSLSSEDLFREMRAVRCIKFAEEYGATSAEQCKQMCLERETFCVGVSFRSGSCKLITSFDCGGWQIFKKLAEDQQPTVAAVPPTWQAAGGVPETASPSMIDLSVPDHGSDHAAASDVLNDPLPDKDMIMNYFYKVEGNCRGGRPALEEMYGTVVECATKCHEDFRCRGYAYIKSEERCALKTDNCFSPNVINPGVAFYSHLERQQ